MDPRTKKTIGFEPIFVDQVTKRLLNYHRGASATRAGRGAVLKKVERKFKSVHAMYDDDCTVR